MQVSPAHLIALLRTRGIRVEIEELLRLHEALNAGSDWTPRQIENVIVGILATCPEDPPKIRDAIRELRQVFEPALTGKPEREEPRPPPSPPGPPPLLSRRVVVSLVVGGAATAAGTIAWLSRRPGIPPTDVPDKPKPPGTENAARGTTTEGGDPTRPEPSKPPEAASSEPAWVAEERAKQAAHREQEAARREAESAARSREIAAIDAARTSRTVVVPRFVPARASWLRRIGAALLGPATALGIAAWLGHRAWRRRSREDRQFGGPALEVAPGASLYWLTPAAREWPPLLDIAARESLVWGVGEATAEEPTRFLDEDATIDATIEHGGLPELRYRRKRRLRRVWLWRDQGESGPLTARLCAEVHQTLHGYGLAVDVGHFSGLPEQFERDDGRVLTLEALEEERESSCVVLLTDGEELLRQWQWRDASGRSRQPQVRTLLRRLSGWPSLTVVHTGDREGLRALRALLEPFGIPCLPIEAFPLAVREREYLARVLVGLAANEPVWMWAALCALYPLPVPEALALALLRELGLAISPLSLAQLLRQSTTTAGIQFPPATRARLIERLRRSLGDGTGRLPPLMRQALAFWRARTIAGEIDWERDASGRGLHRRLVVALLDVWTDPERAARELSALRKSPHMPGIREELGRMRPAVGETNEPPLPGAFHVPFDGAALSPAARTRLQAAGMAGLVGAVDGAAAVRWPGWLRGLVALALLLFAAGVALLVFEAVSRTLDEGASRWALGRRADPNDDRLLAFIAGDWRAVGTWPLPEEYEVEETTVAATCRAGAMRRCPGEGQSGAPPRRIAVLDAARDSVDAVRFADSLLDRGLVDSVWIGEWPTWMIDRSVIAYSGESRLGVWVFSRDPEFVPRASASRSPYPAILGGATGEVVAASLCGAEICAVTAAGGVPRVLRAGATGESSSALPAGNTVLAANYTSSPDGRTGEYRIVTVNQDHAIVVYDGFSGRQLYGYRANGGAIRAMAFNRSGSHFVTASTDRAASIWVTNGSAGDAPLVLSHANDVLAAAFSADGTVLATGSAGNTAFVWDAAQIAAQPLVKLSHQGAVRAVAFTADGSGLVTYADRWDAQIWNWRQESVRAPLKDAREPANAIVIGPAGRIALVGDQVTLPRVWSADTGEVVTTLARHEGGVAAVEFSADGSKLLTAYAGTDTARLWDAASGAELAVFHHGVGPGLVGAGFSSDGKYVYTASGAGTVRVWTAEGRPVSKRMEQISGDLEARWDRGETPTGDITLHPSDDWQHLLTTFSASDAEAAAPTSNRIVYADMSRDPGEWVISGVDGAVTAATETSAGFLVGTQDGGIHRVSAASGEVVKDEAAHARTVTTFVSGAGKILSLAADGTAKLWSSDGTDPRSYPGTQAAVAASAATLDRVALVSVTIDGEFLIKDGEVESTYRWGGDNLGLSRVLDFSGRSSSTVDVISAGSLVTCGEHQKASCTSVWPASRGPLQLVAGFKGSGTIASASADHTPMIMTHAAETVDAPPVAPKLQFKGPIGWPVELRYSPDGKQLAVAALDGTVWLADSPGKDCPRVLRHETPLADIAFSDDSSLLVTGSFDGDVRVFRAADGAGPVRRSGHRGPVHSVAFIAGEAGGTPRILSVSADGSARVWAAPTDGDFAGFEEAESRCVDTNPAVSADPPEPEPVAPEPPPAAPPERNKPPAVCSLAASDNDCEKCVKASCCEALSACTNKTFKACTTSITRFDECGDPPRKCVPLYECTFLGSCGKRCMPDE